MARFDRPSGREPRGRRDSDRGGRDRDRPALEMTRVTCSSCHESCEVPFKPNSSKPVYCRACFDKKGGNDSRDRPQRREGRRDFDRGGRDRPALEMTRVICSDCNSECEVPFKPSSDKPVYCSACFEKKGGNDSRGRGDRPPRREESRSDISKADLDIINEKLNKIMAELDIE